MIARLSVKNSKEKTGRIVCFKEFKIKYSFTLESTFYGRERKITDHQHSDLHMTVADFKTLGADLAKWLNYYTNIEFLRALNYSAERFSESKIEETNPEVSSLFIKIFYF